MIEPLGRNYSRNILLRMLVSAVVAAGIIAWQYPFLAQLYFRNQLTAVGWIVNGAILLLFLTGLVRIITFLRELSREEGELRALLANLSRKLPNPAEGLDPDAIIAQRLRSLADLRAQGASINHGVLSATLLASLSARNSFPKFVHNILILTGVFGTIVALSIALLGASDMLGAGGDASGMDTIIHGMSTALSTTMTAILCYLYYGYFYLKLNDAQTRFLGALEHVTGVYLVPRYQPEPERIANQFGDMIRSANQIVTRLESAHERMAASSEALHGLLARYLEDVTSLRLSMGTVESLLREGFRLPADRQEP
ncbi:MAG: hypothetical protein LJE84_02015 [Gammaproteobacteria bacterium]|nr:hypothetical protein [Gammaproteobacteria bacterium]